MFKNYIHESGKEVEVVDFINLNIYFNWSMEKYGFGQLYFYLKEGAIRCSNECMGKEKIKKIMYAFVDKLVDECVLDDEPFKNQ